MGFSVLGTITRSLGACTKTFPRISLLVSKVVGYGARVLFPLEVLIAPSIRTTSEEPLLCRGKTVTRISPRGVL